MSPDNIRSYITPPYKPRALDPADTGCLIWLACGENKQKCPPPPRQLNNHQYAQSYSQDVLAIEEG